MSGTIQALERFVASASVSSVDVRWLTTTTFEACVTLSMPVAVQDFDGERQDPVVLEFQAMGVLENGALTVASDSGHARVEDEVRAKIVGELMDSALRVAA